MAKRARDRLCLALLGLTGVLAQTGCPGQGAATGDGGTLVVGRSSLVRIADEPPGAACPAGGLRVEVGVDDDGDGLLDDDEVDGAPSFVCSGDEGGGAPASLVTVREEPPGEHCANGGQRVESGRDADGDGLLDDEEVESAAYACAGAPGAAGAAALVELSDAAACAGGGVAVSVGLDSDGDGVLDGDEVALTRAVCAGAAGADADGGADGGETLVDVVDEPAGAACPQGGKRVQLGRDTDGDGLLDPEEVSDTAVICNGADGGSGPVQGPGAGESEGSAAVPVVLDVTAFAGGLAPRVATVAANGRSFYSFTATGVEDPSVPVAPHTLGLFEAESSLAVSLFGDADFASAPIDVTCVDAGVSARACATAPLERGRTYYLAIRDVANLPSSFFLSVSLGADEGSAATPRAVSVGPSTVGSVRGGGKSRYAFTPATSGPHTLALSGVLGEADLPPRLAWTLYEVSERPDRRLWSCPEPGPGLEVRCATPRLVAGTPYVLAVAEGAGFGAVFDLRIEAGDSLTPSATLSAQTVLPEVDPGDFLVQLHTSAAGRYTVNLSGPIGFDWWLYEDLAGATSEQVLFACESRACATPPLSADTTYYVKSRQNDALPSDVTVTVVSRAGDEGSLDAPVDLEMGVAHLGSVEQLPGGESYYRFTAPGAGPVTLRAAFDAPGYPPQCRFYGDPGFAAPLSKAQVLSGDGTCLSETLEGGRAYYLKVSINGGGASTYALTLEAGDTVTPSVGVGSGPNIVDVPANQTVYLQLATSTSPYRVAFTGASASLRRRVWGGHPKNRATTGFMEQCGLDANDCVVEAALFAGVGYLELTDLSGNDNQVTVELTELVPIDATLGVATASAAIPSGELRWYRFTTPTAGFYEAVLARQSGGSFSFDVYDPGRSFVDGGFFGGGGATTFIREISATLVVEPLPAQTFLASVRNEGAGDLDIDVTFQERP